MTPCDIEVLLHFHSSSEPHPRLEAPAVKRSITMLYEEGFLTRLGLGCFNTTERGRTLVKMLCDTPFPVESWKDPRSGSAEASLSNTQTSRVEKGTVTSIDVVDDEISDDVCCESMRKAVKHRVVHVSKKIHPGIVVISNHASVRERHRAWSLPLNHCPWCGRRLKFVYE